jgi:ribA/ribD-fused uncharacterized protein
MQDYIMRFNGENRFLSNFYAVNVKLDGEEYPSVEHAFQAAKTMNPEEREKIRKSSTFTEAKKIGQNVKMRSDWEEIKDGVMLNLLRQKFSKSHEKLELMLIDTGTRHLIEGNKWHDKYWGVCYCDKCMGKGRNKLGYLLMLIRAERFIVNGVNNES